MQVVLFVRQLRALQKAGTNILDDALSKAAKSIDVAEDVLIREDWVRRLAMHMNFI